MASNTLFWWVTGFCIAIINVMNGVPQGWLLGPLICYLSKHYNSYTEHSHSRHQSNKQVFQSNTSCLHSPQFIGKSCQCWSIIYWRTTQGVWLYLRKCFDSVLRKAINSQKWCGTVNFTVLSCTSGHERGNKTFESICIMLNVWLKLFWA